MKIAIAVREGGFNPGWIKVCEEKGWAYSLVSPYESNIISNIKGKGVTHFLWHWHHSSPKDWVFARQLLQSIQMSGIKVFPDLNTCWHFDDKLGQKYLLEAVNLPLVKTWVFYSKKEALDWVTSANWPKVFKLRSGAGSKNVKLVTSQSQAKKIIGIMFGRGVPADNLANQVSVISKAVKCSPLSVLMKCKKIPQYINGFLCRRTLPRQRGYCLFQEFIANNTYDTRIVIVGKRAIGIRRMVRKNDFRASGSGVLDYSPTSIDLECVRIGFEAARKLNSQSLALDFVRDMVGRFEIIEISYGYSVASYYKCPGYWDAELNWHAGKVMPEQWILEDLIRNE